MFLQASEGKDNQDRLQQGQGIDKNYRNGRKQYAAVNNIPI
jgi:hypothetical protein